MLIMTQSYVLFIQSSVHGSHGSVIGFQATCKPSSKPFCMGRNSACHALMDWGEHGQAPQFMGKQQLSHELWQGLDNRARAWKGAWSKILDGPKYYMASPIWLPGKVMVFWKMNVSEERDPQNHDMTHASHPNPLHGCALVLRRTST